MRYYRDVVLPLVESNKIIYYELQKAYELQPKFIHGDKTVQPIKYVADFFIRFSDGKEIIVDTKGYGDSTANIKKKMFMFHYPDIDYQWISYSKIDAIDGNPWVPYEVVNKGRKERKKNKKAG